MYKTSDLSIAAFLMMKDMGIPCNPDINKVAINKRILNSAKKRLERETKYLEKLKEDIPKLEEKLKKSEIQKKKKDEKLKELKNKSKYKCGYIKKNGDKCTIGVKAKGEMCGHHRPKTKS